MYTQSSKFSPDKSSCPGRGEVVLLCFVSERVSEDYHVHVVYMNTHYRPECVRKHVLCMPTCSGVAKGGPGGALAPPNFNHQLGYIDRIYIIATTTDNLYVHGPPIFLLLASPLLHVCTCRRREEYVYTRGDG